jgi:predicted permease
LKYERCATSSIIWERMMRWYQRLFRRARTEKQLDAELRFHLEQQITDYVATGMAPEEARRRARLEFGGIEQVKEGCRDIGTARFAETLIQDVRYGLRQLRRNPGFTAVAIITLALGIGATTAIFTVVNGVLLDPLPYPHPARVMILTESSRKSPEMGVSYLNFLDWQREQRSFSEMAGYHPDAFNLATPRGAEVVTIGTVSADFFKALGIPPALGRGFSAADDHLGAAPTAVLTYGFWQRHFGGKRDVIGKALTMSGQSYTVIGVLPKDFWFFYPEDVYVPIGIYDRIWIHQRRTGFGMLVVGRLKPGVTRGEAEADMTDVARRLAQEYPKADAGHGINVQPALSFLVKDVRTTLYLLLGAVCFVLLIACVNVANLLLGRSAARQKEMGIRAALGAGWRRVVRQLLTESVLLALFGGSFGILLAYAGAKLLLAHVPGELPRAQNAGLDPRVLLFVVVASVVTGIIFGLAPALRSANPDLNDTLKESGRGASRRGHRLQNGLVVAEMGLAVVLLAGAGLTLQSILRLNRVNTGFNPQDTVRFGVSLPYRRYSVGANDRAFYKNVLDRLRVLPGVQAAGMAGGMPMGWELETSFYVEGRPKPQPQSMPVARLYRTSGGYLQAMGIRLLRGRSFTDQDTLGSQPVVLIDDALARKFFPHQNPVGQHLILLSFDNASGVLHEIVGVVHHVKQFGPAGRRNWKIHDALYTPAAQIADPGYKAYGPLDGDIIVRTASAPQTIIPSVKRAVQSVDPAVAVYDFETMDDVIRTSLAAIRFTSLLMAIFAVLALTLAAIGIYGVISYSVSQRTHEIGIRVSLGAQKRDVLALVLSQGMRVALIGIAIGIPVALGLTRFMFSLLHGVKPTDPLTFISVSLILTAVALLASYIPARRATKVDPMVALRHE